MKKLILFLIIKQTFSKIQLTNLKNEEWTCSEGCNTTLEYCYENLTCPYCKNKYYGEKCDLNCKNECLSCEKESGKCIECENGFYGDDCEKKCSKNCKTNFCDKESGYCECKLNFNESTNCEECNFNYTGDNCDKNCNINCDLKYGKNCKKSGECDFCKDSFYGSSCEKNCSENCIKCEKEKGNCTLCKETYYIKKKECEKCSSKCKNNICDNKNGTCIECKYNLYGNYCEFNCPLHCQKNETEEENICNKINGNCNKGCEDYFEGLNCSFCIDGYYKYNETCINCPENCDKEVQLPCNKETGNCNKCKNGYYNDKCDLECDNKCKDKICIKDNGKCVDCIENYYKDINGNCTECPTNCFSKCNLEEGCSECSFNYGKWCNLTCPSNCLENKCEKNSGFCLNCKNNFYGKICNESCFGCKDNCIKDNGECINHNCNFNYFGSGNCNKKCSSKCIGGCDLFNGFCNKCSDKNYFGNDCQFNCDFKECNDDDRIDCCYVKSNSVLKVFFKAQIENYDDNYFINKSNILNLNYGKFEKGNNDFFDSFEYKYINLYVGSKNKLIKVLIDFNSNSPLVLFENSTTFIPIEEEDKIKITCKYNSSESKTYSNKTESLIKTAKFSIFENDGKPSKDNFKIISEDGEINFSSFFLIATKIYNINDNLDLTKSIEGIVGLGFLSLFSESLFSNNAISRNIISKKKNIVLFGDFTENINKDFSKTTTLTPINSFLTFNNIIEIKSNLIGFAVSFRRAYKYELNNISLNLNSNTEIILNITYQKFFEKIYFGSLFGKSCFIRDFIDIKEFYCENENQINKLPKFGILIENYIYYLSHNFLFKKVDNKYKFIIKLGLKGNQKVILGKEFFDEFEVVFNNGNHTLNFYGETRKLNIKVIDLPKNLPDSSDDWLTPGLIVVFFTFTIVILIIFCYCVKYCNNSYLDDYDDNVNSFIESN